MPDLTDDAGESVLFILWWLPSLRNLFKSAIDPDLAGTPSSCASSSFRPWKRPDRALSCEPLGRFVLEELGEPCFFFRVKMKRCSIFSWGARLVLAYGPFSSPAGVKGRLYSWDAATRVGLDSLEGPTELVGELPDGPTAKRPFLWSEEPPCPCSLPSRTEGRCGTLSAEDACLWLMGRCGKATSWATSCVDSWGVMISGRRWRPLVPSSAGRSFPFASPSEGPVAAGVSGGVVMSPDRGLRWGV